MPRRIAAESYGFAKEWVPKSGDFVSNRKECSLLLFSSSFGVVNFVKAKECETARKSRSAILQHSPHNWRPSTPIGPKKFAQRCYQKCFLRSAHMKADSTLVVLVTSCLFKSCRFSSSTAVHLLSRLHKACPSLRTPC